MANEDKKIWLFAFHHILMQCDKMNNLVFFFNMKKIKVFFIFGVQQH